MTTKTTVQVIPEPQGLTSRKLWLQTRLIDIRQVTTRFVDHGKDVPEAWSEELELLIIEIEAEK